MEKPGLNETLHCTLALPPCLYMHVVPCIYSVRNRGQICWVLFWNEIFCGLYKGQSNTEDGQVCTFVVDMLRTGAYTLKAI